MSQTVPREVEFSREERTISHSIIGLQQSLERINTLPAMPVIAQKMLALALNTDEGETQLLKLIAQDPQISAKIIGLSNSSLFGVPGTISSISDAAMYLGLTQVKSIAIGMAALSALAKSPEGKFKSTDLWAHSMAIATAIRAIAKHIPARNRPMDDQIFLSGLLHDIGYNVLNFIAKDISDTLYERLSAASGIALLEIEHELLGTHHGEIGAQLAAHWGLPAEIIAVIRYHHIPGHTNAEVGQPLAKLVNIAEKMLLDFVNAEHTTQLITEQECIDLGIDPSRADAITDEIGIVAEHVAQLASTA